RRQVAACGEQAVGFAQRVFDRREMVGKGRVEQRQADHWILAYGEWAHSTSPYSSIAWCSSSSAAPIAVRKRGSAMWWNERVRVGVKPRAILCWPCALGSKWARPSRTQ